MGNVSNYDIFGVNGNTIIIKGFEIYQIELKDCKIIYKNYDKKMLLPERDMPVNTTNKFNDNKKEQIIVNTEIEELRKQNKNLMEEIQKFDEIINKLK
jgi:hypothetical protein